MIRVALAVVVLLAGMGGGAWGKTSNGNDFALWLSEATNADESKALIDEAKGQPHYFRYLYIMEMAEGEINGVPYVDIVTTEPASLMKVAFRVIKSVSLKKLAEDPPSKIGDAIAVTGNVAAVDPEAKRIDLNPIIVRHKDRLAPKIGKELFYELDSNATCYSFTAVMVVPEVGYSEELWGWTACAGRDGYIGFSKPYNGTLAPSAVVASLPFLPEESLSSIKYMVETYGDRIWGKYGFVDSFNPHQDWYDDGFLGIDKGNEVLMIENFRSEGVWRKFMENPYVQEGLEKAGFDPVVHGR